MGGFLLGYAPLRNNCADYADKADLRGFYGLAAIRFLSTTRAQRTQRVDYTTASLKKHRAKFNSFYSVIYALCPLCPRG
jgi:hypothetical protein